MSAIHRPAAAEMMRVARTEPGCLDYAYAADLADPDLLRVIERWTDDGALAAHSATRHMAAFGHAMASAAITAASIKAYA